MRNAITIDNYDITIHERYAKDQEKLEVKYINEAKVVAPHFEIPGNSFVTKWEELFEIHLNGHPWALFSPPPEFGMIVNRFFNQCLSPNLNWFDQDEEEDDEEKEKQADQELELRKKRIQEKKSKLLPAALLEKDRSVLLNLLDSIQTLNILIREIQSRKLQYQKG